MRRRTAGAREQQGKQFSHAAQVQSTTRAFSLHRPRFAVVPRGARERARAPITPSLNCVDHFARRAQARNSSCACQPLRWRTLPPRNPTRCRYHHTPAKRAADPFPRAREPKTTWPQFQKFDFYPPVGAFGIRRNSVKHSL